MPEPNTDLEFLFTDTDMFPTEEEEDTLKTIKAKDGHYFYSKKSTTIPYEILMSLAKRGFLGTYSHDGGIYFYIKGEHRNRPISIEFHAYHIQMGKTPDGEIKVVSQEEKKKATLGRAFIAKWIFKKNTINDLEHINFLTKFTSRSTYAMSVPVFLWNMFELNIKPIDIQYRIITPTYKTIHCSYCRHETIIRDEHNSAICPECHQDIVIR